MTNARENLEVLAGSIAAALGMILSLVYQSGVLNTLIGVAIGAGITYYVQTKTQNRAWKREYSIKIVENVYGPLHKDLKQLAEKLEEEAMTDVSFNEWLQIQNDHRYFMVDRKFREQLDILSKRIQEHNSEAQKLKTKTLPRILKEEFQKSFKKKTRFITLVIGYDLDGKTNEAPQDTGILVYCLLSNIQPKELFLRGNSDTKILYLKTNVDYGNPYVEDRDFDAFWQSCLTRMRQDVSYGHAQGDRVWVRLETKTVENEIVKRTEEPWRI